MNVLLPLLASAWLSAPEDPRVVIGRALDAMGAPPAIAEAGGLVFHAEGTRNQSAERQGRSPESRDLVPYRETMALDPARDRMGREYRYDRYDGTFEWLRELYEGGQDLKLLVLQDGFAAWLRSPHYGDERRRYERRLPHVLLAEVLERPDALRSRAEADGRVSIEAALSDGTDVTLFFDAGTGLLERVEYLADVQSFGDAAIVWSFEDWAPVSERIRFPRRIGASVAGRDFLELDVVRVETGTAAASALFAAPESITIPGEPRVLGAPPTDASRRAEVREEAPGVYTVRNLRPGFHPLFVDLGECVLAVDAPAGYRLLEQFPAGDVAVGPSSAWLSERYLELIHETLPEKNVCWVALTHFHNDHGGGLRAFVAEGATILVTPGDLAAVERLLQNPHSVAPDRLSRSPRAPSVEVVDARRRLEGGGRSVEILPIGANPHTEEMLVVHLPEEKFLFVSDLLTPAALEDFPTPSHEALDRAFVAWLDGSDLDPDRVYAMHGSGLATREHLD
jgi:glyoxylase-like metal-dependent hydrolase (beta-lactamase superfamily II)